MALHLGHNGSMMEDDGVTSVVFPLPARSRLRQLTVKMAKIKQLLFAILIPSMPSLDERRLAGRLTVCAGINMTVSMRARSG